MNAPRPVAVFMAIVALTIGFLLGSRQALVRGRDVPGAGFAAVPGEKGGTDHTGPYDVVADWPKPLSSLPGHDNWTWGGSLSVFAQNPTRVFILQLGELPALQRPAAAPVPAFGPSLSFPLSGLPFRHATQGPVASLPGGTLSERPEWKGTIGVDARWEHPIMVVDANGNYIEQDVWSRWTDRLVLPHSITINPYDPEKHIWLVDHPRQVIYKFTNDGRELVQTIGTLDEEGYDDTHFAAPTFLAWLPDSTMFVADGYDGTRVVKFDKDGKFLMAWGQKGNPPDEIRPGYFNTVHGIAVDARTRRVFVNDRGNRRVQVFDEDGRFLDQWSFGPFASIYNIYMGDDQNLWAIDSVTNRILKYDLNGQVLYGWGSLGSFPGGFYMMHGISVDQENNLYVAEVGNGRVQKFRPRKGVNPDFLVAQPPRAAWMN